MDYRCQNCGQWLDYFGRGDYLCNRCGSSFHEYELDPSKTPEVNDYEAE